MREQVHKHSIVGIAVVTVLTIVCAFNFLLLFWILSAPQKVLEVKPNPIKISTKSVSPGEYVIASYDFCKNSNAEGRITTTLVSDSVQLSLPTGKEREEKGCRDDIKVPIIIPQLATPGEYHFRFRVTYQVNPLKSVSQDIDTETFMVK